MCYGFSVLAWWFMAWRGIRKKVKRKSQTIRYPTLTAIISTGLTAFCAVPVFVYAEHINFFPSCVPSDIISDRHTYALEPTTLTFYDWISDDISIIPWFWWHVPMCYRNVVLGSNVNIVWEIPICFALPRFRPPPHTPSDLKIWLKYIENYR